jgi:hypothetical protein
VIAYRPALAADLHFIVKGWTSSYRDSNSAGFIKARNWHRVMFAELTETLREPDVFATVAYETSNPDIHSNAYGFIVADTVDDPPLVYFCYVKGPYRRSGIARGLFHAIGVDPESRFQFVCSTPIVSQLQRKIPMSKWTPLLGRFPKSERRKAG